MKTTHIISSRSRPAARTVSLWCAGLAIVAGAWLVGSPSPDPSSATRDQAQPLRLGRGDPHGITRPATEGTSSAVAEPLRPRVGDLGPPPPGLSERDWRALHGVMTRLGHPPEEAQQLVELARYQREIEAMQALGDPDEASARRRMAHRLLDELPRRVRQGEFTLIESALLGSALLTELEPDAARHKARLSRWYTDLVATVPQALDDVAMLRLSKETERKRSQATAFIAWQGEPEPSQRSEARLEQAMRSAQRALNAGG